MQKKKALPKTTLRFFNALPTNDALDFYIDEQLITSTLWFQDFSKYTQLLSGQHTFGITKHKEKTFLATRKVNLRPDSLFTLVAYPSLKDSQSPLLISIEEPDKTTEPENCLVRIISFAPLLPTFRVSLVEEYYLFQRIKYSHYTSYLPTKQGTYTLTLTSQEDDQCLLTLPNVVLKPGRLYSLYLVGSEDSTHPLAAVWSIDGRCYLNL